MVEVKEMEKETVRKTVYDPLLNKEEMIINIKNFVRIFL